MKMMIAGGTGFVGHTLIPYFKQKNNEITVISRSHDRVKESYADQVNSITWKQLEEQGENLLKDIDLIINLAGAGIADQRWTEPRKKIILKSRMDTTNLIVKLCKKTGNESLALFNASACGIYGIQEPKSEGLPPALDETTPIDFDKQDLFSTKITRQWEKATWPAKQAGIRVVNLRFGVVLGKSGGALPKMALPFKLFIGGKVGSGNQPFSWVAIEDLARAIDFLIEHKNIDGPVNIVSPNCVTQAELANKIGKVLDRPSILPTPEILLKSIFGEMANELLLNGQHVYPKVLIENGFKFKYEDIESALKNALT